MNLDFKKIELFAVTIYSLSSLALFIILAPLISIFLITDLETIDKILISDYRYTAQVYSAFSITLEASVIATTILLLIGIPLGYLLSKFEFRGKEVIEAIIDLPLLTPHIVAGIMILSAFGRRGIQGIFGFGGVEDSLTGIILVMMFVSLPIMVDTVKAGFNSVDIKYEYIARSLGANRFNVFKDITLPLAKNSILAGYILAWARGVSEVGALLIVAYYPKSINILIYEWFMVYGLKYAAALSVVLLSLFILIFASIRVLTR